MVFFYFFTGSAIDASLKLLAERRTDIFGVGNEETAIGKKIGEEDVRKDEKVTWDGHTSSVEAATRAARANITLEEQIHQIHKVKGLLPDEEKEKIGPKNVISGGSRAGGKMNAAAVISAKPQANPNPMVMRFLVASVYFNIFLFLFNCSHLLFHLRKVLLYKYRHNLKCLLHNLL